MQHIYFLIKMLYFSGLNPMSHRACKKHFDDLTIKITGDFQQPLVTCWEKGSCFSWSKKGWQLIGNWWSTGYQSLCGICQISQRFMTFTRQLFDDCSSIGQQKLTTWLMQVSGCLYHIAICNLQQPHVHGDICLTINN